MSEPISMNISPQDITNTCNYKCAFAFDYPVSSCVATNSGNSLMMSYIDSTSPVIFNQTKYTITEWYVYSPSLHTFNNTKADAEIVITHTPVSGGSPLLVCIPLSLNGTSGQASTTMSEIIDAVTKGAPSQGGSTSQGITDFTMNDFIPMKEFYNYSSNGQDFIVFGIQSAIFISQANITSLNTVIQPVTSVVFPSGAALFVNSNGPIKGQGINGDNIYIDCQPTNSSEEQTNEVVNNKADTNYDMGDYFKNLFSNPIFIFLVCAIAVVIFLLLIHKGITILTGGSADGTTNRTTI
uniref:Alpha-carbonic anhydrase domain-containing protein n=1 Tax=viral metagenome TaxID=1070528 RepID=A0A6C0B0U8_9ZZZZ